MTSIDYYFTVLSPYTYLAGDQLEQMAARHGATINYKPMNMMVIFEKMGGTPPAKRHVSRQEYRLQELRRISARSGLPFNLSPAHWPCDATPASQAVIAVQAEGGDAGAVARAALTAVWAEERNIADPDTVNDILKHCGHDPVALDSSLAAAAATYDQNTEDAQAAGAFGSPFYIVGEERFWGQDRLDYLDEFLGRG